MEYEENLHASQKSSHKYHWVITVTELPLYLELPKFFLQINDPVNNNENVCIVRSEKIKH